MNKAQQQEKDLAAILKLSAEIAEMGTKHQRLGEEYVKKYCPHKVGGRLIVRPQRGRIENGVIQNISFFEHSTIPGLARIYLRPWSADWKHEKERRYSIIIESREEIIGEAKS